jgi:hypothetical protein
VVAARPRALRRAAAADLPRVAFPATPTAGETRAFIATAFMLIVARGDVARANPMLSSNATWRCTRCRAQAAGVSDGRAHREKRRFAVSISNTSNLLGADRQPSSLS